MWWIIVGAVVVLTIAMFGQKRGRADDSVPPPPTPGLWQIYGAARAGNFSLRAVASVKGADHRETKFLVTVQGTTLLLTESGNCSRKAALTRK